jgi:hypothetical protein
VSCGWPYLPEGVASAHPAVVRRFLFFSYLGRSDDSVCIIHTPRIRLARTSCMVKRCWPPKDTQFDTFKSCLSLFKMAERKRAIISVPLPRYLHSCCCEDESLETGMAALGQDHSDTMRDSVETSGMLLQRYCLNPRSKQCRDPQSGKSCHE